MFGMLRSLWLYRHFVRSSISNELRSRFVRSKLGGLWIILNPLAQVAIYALILSNILAAKLPGVQDKYAYSIYLMAGLLAWNLFNEIVSRCLNLFIAQANLMKKLSFPRITLPTITVGTCLLDNLLLLIAILGIVIALGHKINLTVLFVLPLTLIVVALAIGIGLILGILNVFIRDTSQIVPIVLQVWFWFTPIVYPQSIIPEAYRHWLMLNPMYPLVIAYQDLLLLGISPNIESLIPSIVTASAFMLVGLFMFRRASAELVDVL